jgi:hypothetical protein
LHIEELNLSETCLKEWKRSGFNNLEEVLYFLSDVVGNATMVMTISNLCFIEMVDELLELGFLSPDRWGKQMR